MECGVSLEFPVVSSIFVFVGRFFVVEVSNFLAVGCVYSFLGVFLRPSSFSISLKNEGLLT